MSPVRLTAIVAILLGGPALPALAQSPRTAVTQHVAQIRGKAVPYTARVAETIVDNPVGKPAAAVVTIAYLRSDVKDPRRPVIFFFNGGPGASSSPLHMNASGPVVRTDTGQADRTAGGYANNPDSPLDVADLVFVDPVSTGFSRALPGADPQPFYDNLNDAMAVADVIQQWLKTNGRTAAPRFLAGESYGTTRAPLIAKYRPTLKWDGILLISGGGGLVGPGMAEANRIPTMAAAAWYHNAVDRRGLTIDQFYDAASRFARGDYAAAIVKDPALGADEKARVAATLAGFIGLPAAELAADDLKVTGDYTMRLLKDRGLRLGRLDTRVTGPLPRQAAASAIDDPSLRVVAPGKEAGATPEAIGPVPSPVVGRYVTEQLKFPATDAYIGVNFTANSKWVRNRNPERPAKVMADVMAADPKVRLYAVNGYYDLGATDGAGFLQAGVPANRLTAIQLAGPHQVYDGDGARATFNQSIRDFVTKR